MQEKEEWRDIAGYEGYYQVSNLGNVRSLTRSVIVKESVKRVLREDKYWNPEYEFDREIFDSGTDNNERLEAIDKKNEENDYALFRTYKWVKNTLYGMPEIMKSDFQGVSRIKDEKTSEGFDLYSFELFVSPERVKVIPGYAKWFNERCGMSVDVHPSNDSIIFAAKKAEFEDDYNN